MAFKGLSKLRYNHCYESILKFDSPWDTMRKLRSDFKDISGQKFGRLTALEIEWPSKNSRRLLWKCKCDCGKFCKAPGSDLRNGYRVSCGCRGVRKIYLTAVNSLYSSYMSKAKKRKQSFYLAQDVFNKLILKNCFYCDIEPKQVYKTSHGSSLIYNGIDRIDPSQGYIKSNCVPCCKYCNFAKNDLQLDEFKEHIKRIYKCLIGS